MKTNDAAHGTYLMVLPVPFYRTGTGTFASESAFFRHLRILKQTLGDEVSRLVVAGPYLDADEYASVRSSWVEVNEADEGIYFHPLHPANADHATFVKLLPSLLRGILHEVESARVIHSGPSFLYRPLSIASLIAGAALGKVTISVTDIDNRESARMNLETGVWSKKQYWTTKLLHHTSDHLQHLLVAQICSLVLLKGKGLAEDYGGDGRNVKNFLDSAYSAEHLIRPDELESKLARLADPNEPLRLTYYGRLVAYKGVDHMLRALDEARRTSGSRATFDVFGDGPERDRLTALCHELGLDDVVRFHGAVPFGTEFFRTLGTLDVLLAAPLSQDTPRSALDAQASGQFVLAYDTYYYRDLAASRAAVGVVPWRDTSALARELVRLDRHRDELASAIRGGVAFATDNTQERWLDRRTAWTRDVLSGSRA